MQFLRALAILVVLSPASAASWSVARSSHFEVFTDASPEIARASADSLELLRAFFQSQTGITPPRTVRLICFASETEFATYRIRPGAAAFSLHTSDRDYIVMPASDLPVAGHEYTHLVIHSSGWNVPEWLAEGISEVASTVRVSARVTLVGGDLRGRSALLKSGRWLTPANLFDPPPREDHDPVRDHVFYSESWALAEMLMTSTVYAPRFPALLAMLARGSSSQAALEGVYRTSIDAIFRDLHARQLRGASPASLPGIALSPDPVQVTTMSMFDANVILADLRRASGDLVQAEEMYRALAGEQPRSAEVRAALGVIALERHDPARAVEEWGRAMALGLDDAALCFRYAELAGERGLPEAAVFAALERAVALRPEFDEAHFRLAIMEKNDGHAEAAVEHLHRMQSPAPDRAWIYYTTLADALLDLEQRDAASRAAEEARRHAASDAERDRAEKLVWLANSVLTVEISADPQGRRQFRTVRVPVQSATRNPFFEATDDARTVAASLEEVKCFGKGLAVVVSTTKGRLDLSVPDPLHVQIRNGGGEKFEFVCGPQKSRPVIVEYAAPSTLRGLEFK